MNKKTKYYEIKDSILFWVDKEIEGYFNIPDGVTHIGSYAFSGCTSLPKADKEAVKAKVYKLMDNYTCQGLCLISRSALGATSSTITDIFPNWSKRFAIDNFGASDNTFWWDKEDKELRIRFLNKVMN